MNYQQEIYQRVSLRGLDGVHVLVTDLDTENEIEGLDKAQILKHIDNILGTAGINVLTVEEALTTPGIPCLYVSVDSMKGAEGLWAYSTIVELLQAVYLVRDQSIRTYAATWSSSVKGITTERNLQQNIHDDLRYILEFFISNYFSVNQKV